MSKVIAKFRVLRKSLLPSNDQAQRPTEVVLGAVSSEPFGKYTPSGEIKMFIQNDEAEKAFKVGEEYFVEFTPCREVTE